MHLWQLNKWKSFYQSIECRRGLRVRYEKGVDPELKKCIADFCQWIRREFDFPIRVVIYVKNTNLIKAADGEMVVGTFLGPFDRTLEPYIRVAMGDYDSLVKELGSFNAVACELECIAHELSHYFQWINGLKLTPKGEERQASYYANAIVLEYIEISNISGKLG